MGTIRFQPNMLAWATRVQKLSGPFSGCLGVGSACSSSTVLLILSRLDSGGPHWDQVRRLPQCSLQRRPRPREFDVSLSGHLTQLGAVALQRMLRHRPVFSYFGGGCQN